MLFVELKFFIFFAVVLSVYWNLRKNLGRKWILLFASYFFYGSWDWRFAGMLLVLSTADYYFAFWLSRTEDALKRKFFVCASIGMNLTVLGFFKYFNFFVESAVELAAIFHVKLSDPTLLIILPVGVSFFTFQSLSYTIDVYKKEIPPAQSLLDYLVFSSFFPQLVAGPIVRPSYFLPQLDSARVPDWTHIRQCLILFLLGFIKKTCFADNVSPYVDQVFSNSTGYDNISVIAGVWLYAVQIYCDFSGYTDMAIATAGFLGFRLALNFDAPYLSISIQEFWRRWHISLSSWIRDYIYIPLGGRAENLLITYRNLLITMLAGGLWHGAAWTFIVWGGLHGIALVAHQEFRRIFGKKEGAAADIAGWFITINFVCIAWIFFRAQSFASAWELARKYTLFERSGAVSIPTWLIALPAILLLMQWIYRKLAMELRLLNLPPALFALGYGCTWALAISLLPIGYRPFIYFQF